MTGQFLLPKSSILPYVTILTLEYRKYQPCSNLEVEDFCNRRWNGRSSTHHFGRVTLYIMPPSTDEAR